LQRDSYINEQELIAEANVNRTFVARTMEGQGSEGRLQITDSQGSGGRLGDWRSPSEWHKKMCPADQAKYKDDDLKENGEMAIPAGAEPRRFGAEIEMKKWVVRGYPSSLKLDSKDAKILAKKLQTCSEFTDRTLKPADKSALLQEMLEFFAKKHDKVSLPPITSNSTSRMVTWISTTASPPIRFSQRQNSAR
jgi:hypothetical protein